MLEAGLGWTVVPISALAGTIICVAVIGAMALLAVVGIYFVVVALR
jgi:hypothetical protein